MYSGGYMGKVLRINLTDKTSKKEKLPLEVAKDFIGGAGFGIKYLFDEVKGATDPLGPENKLIYAPGPFSGTTIPCASRMAVVGKSPLTNAVGMALSGGYFPVELKFAGYDVLLISLLRTVRFGFKTRAKFGGLSPQIANCSSKMS
jgi:aldehyde:ferredoxin oxidoreductase